MSAAPAGAVGLVEGETEIRLKIERLQRRRTALLAGQRPGLQTIPVILAGVVDEHRRRLGRGRAGLQVLIEERLQNIAAKLQRGVAIPFQRSQIVGVGVHLAVPPRTHHQVVVIGLAFGLQREVGLNRAPHVLLVPQTLNPHGRHLRRLRRHQLVQGLPLPERIVGRVLDHLLRPRKLIQTVQARVGAGRPGAPECLVVVIRVARHRLARIALRRLLVAYSRNSSGETPRSGTSRRPSSHPPSGSPAPPP